MRIDNNGKSKIMATEEKSKIYRSIWETKEKNKKRNNSACRKDIAKDDKWWKTFRKTEMQ